MRKLLPYICLLILFVSNGVEVFAQGKNFIKGLKGQDTLTVGRVWAATMVVPGYGQAYNKQYWKIPVIYGGIGSLTYVGYHFNGKKQEAWGKYQSAIANNNPAWVIDGYKKNFDNYKHGRNLAYTGAALFYIGGALDAVWQYKTDKSVLPEKPTIYSALIPGLGQIYNKEYWKVPIIYGGLAFCGYLINHNNIQYNRFRDAYNNATGTPSKPHEFENKNYTPENLKYFRDGYRRNRDYSILAFVIVYALNIIDANVFAHLADYDISDNLSMKFEPTLFDLTLTPITYTPTVGFNIKLTLK
ncbi:MAG: DUF5683 domain-containing protein [Prevotellaceae bacterium]|nr:DUF5683 domain-containing protein [Prevotellaceae bacterium]